MMNKKRLDYYDIAKGIGVICIVLGHLGIEWIVDIVFPFHVPLFLIISGTFLSNSISTKDFIKKRAKQLLLPYLYTVLGLVVLEIIWGKIVLGNPAINDILNVIIRGLYASGTNDNITLFGIEQIGAIWFLWALFWAQIIVKMALNTKYELQIILLSFILGYFSSKYIWLPFSIQAGLTSALYVYIGYIINREKSNFYKKELDSYILLIGALVLAIESHFGIKVFVVKNRFDYLFISIIGSVIIAYAIIIFSRYIQREKCINKILCYFGKNSLTVLCLHIIELSLPWHLIIFYFIPDAKGLVYYIFMILIKFTYFIICCTLINKIKALINNNLFSCNK